MRKRHKMYQEQNLARAAVAAGASFGWTDTDDLGRTGTDWAVRHRMASLVLPILFLTPFASSVAYYFAR